MPVAGAPTGTSLFEAAGARRYVLFTLCRYAREPKLANIIGAVPVWLAEQHPAGAVLEKRYGFRREPQYWYLRGIFDIFIRACCTPAERRREGIWRYRREVPRDFPASSTTGGRAADRLLLRPVPAGCWLAAINSA